MIVHVDNKIYSICIGMCDVFNVSLQCYGFNYKSSVQGTELVQKNNWHEVGIQVGLHQEISRVTRDFSRIVKASEIVFV